MQCYECLQTGEVRDAAGLCHHCSAALCGQHIVAVTEPMLAPEPVSKEVTLPKRARVMLCRTCKAALEQTRHAA